MLLRIYTISSCRPVQILTLLRLLSKYWHNYNYCQNIGTITIIVQILAYLQLLSNIGTITIIVQILTLLQLLSKYWQYCNYCPNIVTITIIVQILHIVWIVTCHTPHQYEELTKQKIGPGGRLPPSIFYGYEARWRQNWRAVSLKLTGAGDRAGHIWDNFPQLFWQLSDGSIAKGYLNSIYID